jgi:hypothetical protein
VKLEPGHAFQKMPHGFDHFISFAEPDPRFSMSRAQPNFIVFQRKARWRMDFFHWLQTP